MIADSSSPSGPLDAGAATTTLPRHAFLSEGHRHETSEQTLLRGPPLQLCCPSTLIHILAGGARRARDQGRRDAAVQAALNDREGRLVSGREIGEKVEECDGVRLKAIMGIQRRAHSAAVGAPCREIYAQRRGKLGIRAVKRQPGDERAVGERGRNRFGGADFLIAHPQRAGKFPQRLKRSALALEYAQQVGSARQIAVSREEQRDAPQVACDDLILLARENAELFGRQTARSEEHTSE